LRKPTLKGLHKKTKDTVREYIRLRDRDTCQRCNKLVYGINSHPSHVKPVSTHGFLRYDELNIKLLCFHCHRNFWHLNITEAAEWFKHRFPERAKYLTLQGQRTHQWKPWELEELIEEYKGKIKELEG